MRGTSCCLFQIKTNLKLLKLSILLLGIWIVRRNKQNYPYCLRLPEFYKIRAWESLVPVKEGMERMTLLLIHCKVGVLRVRS